MSNEIRRALVCGAGGFIGSHLVKRLKSEGFWVRGTDIKHPEFGPTHADEFIKGDLRDAATCRDVVTEMNDVYQLGADMGGAGYVFTGAHDAAIMHSSALINLNMIQAAVEQGVRRIFYSSSACIYPAYNQEDPENPNCAEDSAYPAAPDSDYGWEKLFSERLYLAYHRNTGIAVRIARFHNIFGPEGTWQGGREKSPAAICRKVAEASNQEAIEIWGDGQQTRSFLYIDECVEGIRRLVESDFTGPVNIGSDEIISIDNLAYMVMHVAGKHHPINHIPGPLGVRGRNSDNRLIRTTLGWAPSQPLETGIKATYEWIAHQVEMSRLRNGRFPSGTNGSPDFAAEG
ncbi:MAG: NAD-dependent epimerase/dehydratase family protein [Candidatus Binataceae bacterium]|jgi:nucleoside-diphosphate-sugar epimerase